MSAPTTPPTGGLAGLKDFQRRTVDYVFRRLWLDENPTTRFLVADEVGLGKTMVARGVIARTIAHLKEKGVGRIDVAYVCSNAAIAQQNVNRLNVLEEDHLAFASRLTLLPVQLHRLEENDVNFVSFTPGTTFDLKSSGGVWKERRVIHRILTQAFPGLAEPLTHLLRGDVKLSTFRRRLRSEESQNLNETLAGEFIRTIQADPAYLRELFELCRRFQIHRDEVPADDRGRQFSFIGGSRRLLAEVCIEALEPDLVILDEFQRFRELLDGDSDAAVLARKVMNYTAPEGHRVRVLLLSATPYKPLTLGGEEENHYEDFVRTLRFLFDDDVKVAQLEEQLRIYRRGLYRNGDSDLPGARRRMEELLRSVMVRTERVGATQRSDAMVSTRARSIPIRTSDLVEARFADRVAQAVDGGAAMEYWKSAPFLLHFMKDYQLKRNLEAEGDRPSTELLQAIRAHGDHLLDRGKISRYEPMEVGHARLRALMEEMLDPGQWRLLWVHPSLPYLEPGGAYAQVPEFTKALIFSSWQVVPDTIAGVCSYEAERRMLTAAGEPPDYTELGEARRPLLRFSRQGDRLGGMPTLALLYPSVALQNAVDPLRMALEVGEGRPASVEAVRSVAGEAVSGLLRRTGLWPRSGEGPPDQRWYWAALALLDREHLQGRRRWLSGSQGWKKDLLEGDESELLTRHIEFFREVAEGSLDEELGPAPDDLVEVLVDFALAGPAICAARALRRVAPELPSDDIAVAQGAARVAVGFRTLFNLPESISLLRGSDPEAYWRAVLHHGVDGNLQAVLDEFAHQLRDGLGLSGQPSTRVVADVAEEIADALSIRTAPVQLDEVDLSHQGKVRLNRFRLRTRFSLKFGDLRDDQDQTLARAGTVRAAFNSPFRPFILSTTSIGQEGLDFHRYSHAVYHWNLPSNPVDLEQREGRVQRFKGHAVRRNVARRWGLDTLRSRMDGAGDPWEVLFRVASENRPPGASDLIPFWIYETEGGVEVERRIPMFPFSKEIGRLVALQKGVALYRLAFGQPRQEDLLQFLAARAENQPEPTGETQRICLEPPGVRAEPKREGRFRPKVG